MTKRRSLAPIAHGKKAALTGTDLSLNDDEAEKTVRRKSLAAFRQKRKSLAVTMNESEVDQVGELPENKENIKRALDSYSEMIKLCSSKKLTVKNTWSLSLIDHIDHILDSHKGSFQKASCTLQASVQIYEKRVDSTHMDTFRMLDNVNRTGKRSEVDGEKHRESRRKHKGKANGSTLEANLNAITTTKVEKEYDVDPLFRKMSKTFDEGGAEGMLLNHLLVHSGPRVIFDTSNTQAFPTSHEEPGMEISKEDSCAFFQAIAELVPKEVDGIEACKTIGTLRQLASAKGFEPSLLMNDTAQMNDDYLSDDNEYFGTEGGMDDYDEGPAFENTTGEVDNVVNPPNSRDMAQDQEERMIEERFFAAAGNAESEYSYFTQNVSAKSWAGPSYWKFGRPAKPRAESTASKAKTGRKTKKAYFIDFGAELDPTLYTKAPKQSSISLIKAANLKNQKQYLLPEDVRYTPKDLSQLFLRPENVRIKMVARKRDGQGLERVAENTVAEFANEEAEDYDYFDPSTGGTDGYDDEPEGLEQHFDGMAREDQKNGEHQGAPFLSGMDIVTASRKVEKVEIEFARKAKRVNVIKLKKDIWEEIEEVETSEMRQEPQEKKSFCESINKLEPKVDDSNVTIPFYFICLLHLANEKGLELEGQEDLSDFQIIV